MINMTLDSIVVPQQFAQPGQRDCRLPIGPSQELASLGAPFLQSACRICHDIGKTVCGAGQAQCDVVEYRGISPSAGTMRCREPQSLCRPSLLVAILG